jgi:hydrogenase nickel incorporation protein HypA/HybF
VHELSIAENIAEIAIDHLRKDGGSVVKVIELEIGTLSGIEIDALNFAMKVVMRNSPLQNAEVRLIIVQGISRCNACGREFDMVDFYTPCPDCGSFDNRLLQGGEMRVKSLLVQD